MSLLSEIFHLSFAHLTRKKAASERASGGERGEDRERTHAHTKVAFISREEEEELSGFSVVSPLPARNYLPKKWRKKPDFLPKLCFHFHFWLNIL